MGRRSRNPARSGDELREVFRETLLQEGTQAIVIAQDLLEENSATLFDVSCERESSKGTARGEFILDQVGVNSYVKVTWFVSKEEGEPYRIDNWFVEMGWNRAERFTPFEHWPHRRTSRHDDVAYGFEDRGTAIYWAIEFAWTLCKVIKRHQRNKNYPAGVGDWIHNHLIEVSTDMGDPYTYDEPPTPDALIEKSFSDYMAEQDRDPSGPDYVAPEQNPGARHPELDAALVKLAHDGSWRQVRRVIQLRDQAILRGEISEREYADINELLFRPNPSPSDEGPMPSSKALRRYTGFHQNDPKKIGSFASSLVIPSRAILIGDAVHILYKSDKLNPTTGVDEGWINYIHEHEGGVKVYRCDGRARGDERAVPQWLQNADDLVWLGQCNGFAYQDDDGVHEAKGNRPLPDLFCTPNGKALLIIQSKRTLLAMIWGGRLGVQPRGIVH